MHITSMMFHRREMYLFELIVGGITKEGEMGDMLMEGLMEGCTCGPGLSSQNSRERTPEVIQLRNSLLLGVSRAHHLRGRPCNQS